MQITGSAVALHCCKDHAKINKTMGNSTPCKIVTLENIISKLWTRDYVGEMTHHANFGFNRCSGGLLPKKTKCYHLVTFLTVLSCPVLSCPVLTFFSILRSGRTAGPIFTFYGSNDVFPPKDVPFGVRTTGDHIWGKYAPRTPKNGRE